MSASHDDDRSDPGNPYRWSGERTGEARREPESQSWSKWWLLGCLPLGLILLCGGGCAGVLLFVFGALKSSEPYVHSLQRAKASPQLAAAIGEPMEAGLAPSGNLNLDGANGSAKLNYTLTGPKDSAVVMVEATRAAGKWTYQRMEALVAGNGETIDLREPDRPE